MGIVVLALVQTNDNLVKQVTSYSDLESMRNVPMASNGDGGRFLPAQNLFYVRTNWGEKASCLTSLHEIAHSIQWKNKDKCFYDLNDLSSCEEFAINYAKENTWRCEGLQ